MGFDFIDRQFRKPGPIALECTTCQSIKDVQSRDIAEADKVPLCQVCYDEWLLSKTWSI